MYRHILICNYGLRLDIIADVRKAQKVVPGHEVPQLGRRLKSRFVTSALERKRRTMVLSDSQRRMNLGS